MRNDYEKYLSVALPFFPFSDKSSTVSNEWFIFETTVLTFYFMYIYGSQQIKTLQPCPHQILPKLVGSPSTLDTNTLLETPLTSNIQH